MIKFFISGPIDTHGNQKKNLKAFNEMAEHLKSMGYKYINPARLVNLKSFKHADYVDFLTQGIRDLVKCGGMILLPNWRKSRGVKIEVIIAKALGFLIVEIVKIKIGDYRLKRVW